MKDFRAAPCVPWRVRRSHWRIPIRSVLYFLLITVSCCFGQEETTDIELLRKEAYNFPDNSPERLKAWERILQLDPRNLEARVMLGTSLWSVSNKKLQQRGFSLLEQCFDPKKVSPVIDMKFPQAIVIAATIGRYHSQHKEHSKGKHFTELAFEAMKDDTCLELQLATMLDPFPLSIEEADQSASEMMTRSQAFLQRDHYNLDEQFLSQNFPGAADDPYGHCIFTIFMLSFYYRAETAQLASQHFAMAAAVWPSLLYVAPHIVPEETQCVDRRIKLGIVSGTLNDGHSVTEDFRGVLERLDRDIFHVHYIYVADQVMDPRIASFTQKHAQDATTILTKEPTDVNDGAWTLRMSRLIANMELDMILYPDLTMSAQVRRIGMGRLAPVQLTSHGHPVTSGHPDSIVQYFVSWAEAELPYNQSKTHYTEQLKLIPKGKIHQYYERRILPGDVSGMDGQPFGHLNRRDFDLPVTGNMYLCMQKPFKLHPEFDALVCGILQRDSSGFAILHRETSDRSHGIFKKRLTQAGCDMARVQFLPAQPHHRLLALYREATVVLDSYPAGGCTTTREVLELGKALVTLPARLLGGRWTLGYFNIIDLNAEAKEALIARSEEEYIELAVALGTDVAKRKRVEAHIHEAVPRLFHRHEAVEEWQKILVEASPVHQCEYTKEEL